MWADVRGEAEREDFAGGFAFLVRWMCLAHTNTHKLVTIAQRDCGCFLYLSIMSRRCKSLTLTGLGLICPDQKVTETFNTHTHTRSPHQGLNPYCCCWCCYGLLWCWSNLILDLTRTQIYTQITVAHTSHTVLNCLFPFFVFIPYS